MLQILLPGAPIVGVFLHQQEHGGQDHTFQFQNGLANYKAHYDLS
jgi:hypothetical protein